MLLVIKLSTTGLAERHRLLQPSLLSSTHLYANPFTPADDTNSDDWQTLDSSRSFLVNLLLKLLQRRPPFERRCAVLPGFKALSLHRCRPNTPHGTSTACTGRARAVPCCCCHRPPRGVPLSVRVRVGVTAPGRSRTHRQRLLLGRGAFATRGEPRPAAAGGTPLRWDPFSASAASRLRHRSLLPERPPLPVIPPGAPSAAPPQQSPPSFPFSSSRPHFPSPQPPPARPSFRRAPGLAPRAPLFSSPSLGFPGPPCPRGCSPAVGFPLRRGGARPGP